MRPGEVVEVDFGIPLGSEGGFRRPAIVVTSSLIMQVDPATFQVVPMTTNVKRDLPYELRLDSWEPASAAQCHLVTTIDRAALTGTMFGRITTTDLRKIRELLRDILDLED